MKTKNIIIIIILITFTLFLLPGVRAPHLFKAITKAKWDSIRSKMAPIEAAIYTYKLNTGNLPDKLEDLIYCPDKLKDVWKGPYLKEKQLYDLWDNPYVYQINPNDPNSYVLISYGTDGEPGGEGYDADIYND